MERRQAQKHLKDIRNSRHALSGPIRDPNATEEEKRLAVQSLSRFRDSIRDNDPDYKQALRVIAEMRADKSLANESAYPQGGYDQKKGERDATKEFPKDPEERFKVVISAIGNNAAKQITFLSIPGLSGSVITPSELHKEFVKNSSGVWNTSESAQAFHAKKTLIPFGLVERAKITKNDGTKEVTGPKPKMVINMQTL